jgi:hypothetical protein
LPLHNFFEIVPFFHILHVVERALESFCSKHFWHGFERNLFGRKENTVNLEAPTRDSIEFEFDYLFAFEAFESGCHGKNHFE